MSELSYKLGKAIYSFEEKHRLLFRAGTYALLALIISLGVYLRALPAINFGLELYEADPFVVYWQAKYVYEHGLLSWYSLTQDNPATHIFWYPWGRDFVHTEYPALPMWEALSYRLVSWSGIGFKDWCALQPLLFAAITMLVVYLTAVELTDGNKLAGLFASAFFALVPAATGRSIVGFSTKYGIGIMFATLFVYLYTKFVKSFYGGGSQLKPALYLVLASLSFAMLGWSWGGFIYMYGAFIAFMLAMPLFVPREATPKFVASNIALLALTLFFVKGSPSITGQLGLEPFRPTAIGPVTLYSLAIPVAFSLLYHEHKKLGLRRPLLTPRSYFAALLALAAAGIALLYAGRLDIAGRFAWILGLREIASNPIYASVEEHQPALTTMGISGVLRSWGTYADWLFFASPFVLAIVGSLYLLYRGRPDRVLVAVSFLLAAYAYMNAAYMEVTAATTGLTVAGVMAGTVASKLLPQREQYAAKPKKRQGYIGYGRGPSSEVFALLLIVLISIVANAALTGAYVTYQQLSNTVPSIKAGYASLPFWTNAWYKAIDVIRSTPPDSLVVAWWDYGYPISVLGGRPSVADGSTLNTTQIGILGLILTASNTSEALKLLKLLNPPANNTYILVFDVFMFRPTGNSSYEVMPIVTGSMTGLDDIPKSVWMIRIGDSVVSELRAMGIDVTHRSVGNAFYLYYFQNAFVISPRFDDLSGAPLLYKILVDGILMLNKYWNKTVTFSWYTGTPAPMDTLVATYPQLSSLQRDLGITSYIQVLTTKTLTYSDRPLANESSIVPYAVIAEPYYDKSGNKVVINGAYLYEVITIYKVVF